jgi:uncharacterized BrkB/YihY/UPF0761 family membrane protein
MASGIDNTSGGLPAAYLAAPAERPGHARANGNGLLTQLRALDRPTMLIGSVALTCFSALALLCVAGFAAGLVGLVGRVPGTQDAVLAIAHGLVPAEPADALGRAAGYLTRHGGLAFVLCVVALVGTAGAGAAYARVFRWTVEIDPRDAPRSGAIRVAALPVVIAATILGAAIAAAVVISGPVAEAIARGAGLGQATVDLWGILKWPLAAGSYVALLFALSAQMRGDRLGEPAWAAATRWSGLLVWIITLAGFVYYIAAFGSFAGNYGAGWAAAPSLLWLGLFAMLFMTVPMRLSTDVRPLLAGTLTALACWLPASIVMAVVVANVGPLSGVVAATVLAITIPAWLWASNVGLLAGTAVRRSADLGVHGPPAREAAPSSVEAAVALALADDSAQDEMLSVIPAASGTPPGGFLTDLERDVIDWGYTYGVAWAIARSRYPGESPEEVARRALAAAREVFSDYMAETDWAKRIESERRLERVPMNGAPARNGGGRHAPDRLLPQLR